MIGYSEDPPRGRRRTFSAVDQPTPKLLGLHRTPNKALHYSSTSSCNEQLSRSISVGARGQDACPSDRETLDGPVEALDSDEEFLGKLFQACLGLYLGAWKLGRRLDSFPGDKLLWIVVKFLGLGPADTDATGSTSATTAGHVGDAPLCPTPAATAQNSGTNKRKRTGNPSNGGKKVRVNVESTKNSSLPPERRWACPFHKHDIDTCLSVFSLARIVDVRQHIHRKHTQPLHCPICGINFKHSRELGDHIRARACLPRPFQCPGATQDQLDHIHHCASDHRHRADKTDEDRWFEIYEILFPGEPHPLSPYDDPQYMENIKRLRRGTARFLDGPNGLQLVQQIMDIPEGNTSALEIHRIMVFVVQQFSSYLQDEAMALHEQSNARQSNNAQSILLHSPAPSHAPYNISANSPGRSQLAASQTGNRHVPAAVWPSPRTELVFDPTGRLPQLPASNPGPDSAGQPVVQFGPPGMNSTIIESVVSYLESQGEECLGILPDGSTQW